MDSNYKINTVKISELTPDDKNANKGTDYGKELMDNSFKKFGAGRSILIDKNNRIIAGNKSTQQCAEIGINDVIIIETDGKSIVAVKRTDIDLDSKEGRELAIADNATQKANLEWDEDNLKEIVDEWGINTDDWGIEFTDVIDDTIDEDEVPLFAPDIIKFGDIIELNNHRLLCGDSCNTSDVELLMNKKKADLVFTDPPYDLDKNKEWIYNLNSHIVNGHILIMAADKQVSDIFAAIEGEFHRMYIADTGIASPTNNDVYINHILTLRFSKGKFNKFNNIHNGGRSIIKMDYRRNNKESVFHPHSKPVSFVELFVQYWSNPNQLVFDLFGGSGSTLIACEKNNRICYLNEFEPVHCDIILKRWILYMKEHNKLFEIKINGKKINEDIIKKYN